MPKTLKQSKIIFFGTPAFAVPSLHELIARGNVVAVVTQPDKPVGRSKKLIPPPVKVEATKHGIPVLQPQKLKGNADVIEKLSELNPEFFVVVAYGNIIPQDILDIAPAINAHPSLLPELRGPSPIQTAILQGKTKTGISIMLLDAEMDHGPIIAQEHIEFLPDEYYPEVETRLAHEAAEFLVESLDAYIGGLIHPKEQDHSRATYCSLFTKEDGRIDWDTTAVEVYNKIRALNPWPATYANWGDKTLKITRANVLNPAIGCAESDIGKTFLTEQKELAINCKKGSLIIERVQLEGKKEMDSMAFLKGYPLSIGARLK